MPLELTVHVLDNAGFQIHAEKVRRPPMTEEEKAAKRRHRVVLYAELPPEMLNLRQDVYRARLTSFKSVTAGHFMKKGAAHVGFCQAQDKEGHNLNRIIVFIELFPEGAPTGEFAANSLQGAKYIDVKCRFPAKLKLAKSGDHGLRNCCFKKQCTPGLGPRGAISCDAVNYYMDSEGKVQKTEYHARSMVQESKRTAHGTKRALDASKEEAKLKSASGIAAHYEMHSCVQNCRAFERGRCIKHHDSSLPVGDPRRCFEQHDRPKNQIKCCSTLVPGDEFYHRNFTKCRYKMIGEPCQYMCNNEAT